jgi:hypothetical protein
MTSCGLEASRANLLLTNTGRLDPVPNDWRSNVKKSFLPLVLLALFLAPSTRASAQTIAPAGPGAAATDQRTPELGDDLSVLERARVTMTAGIRQATRTGPVIEAKYELDDHGALSLSLYPAGHPLAFDAERNVFEELAGDPTARPFTTSLEVFADQEHLTRSSRDLTLVQLSRVTLPEVVADASSDGSVYWAIPTIRHGRAGYGVYTYERAADHDCGAPARATASYRFVDGGGSARSTRYQLRDLGTGPGAAATDQRTPELGNDLSVLRRSRITMAQALARSEARDGPAIEAKFELDDQGHLSLSIYPVGHGMATDAERNTFFEAAGDPTAATFSPALTEFTVPDVEHLTRAARDLTLVQTAGLSLRAAVAFAQARMPGGFVFWAIPTIREARAGYGVYVLGRDGTVHYFFVS